MRRHDEMWTIQAPGWQWRLQVTGKQAHSRVARWAVVEAECDGSVHRHIVGWLMAHDRLDWATGEPYISRDLASVDMSAQEAANTRGKLIRLEGPAHEPGCLDESLVAMMGRAEDAWDLPPGTKWKRVA